MTATAVVWLLCAFIFSVVNFGIDRNSTFESVSTNVSFETKNSVKNHTYIPIQSMCVRACVWLWIWCEGSRCNYFIIRYEPNWWSGWIHKNHASTLHCICCSFRLFVCWLWLLIADLIYLIAFKIHSIHLMMFVIVSLSPSIKTMHIRTRIWGAVSRRVKSETRIWKL